MTDAVADELLRLVDEAAERLRPLGEAVVSRKPAAEVWSVKQVLGHLVDSAANNHQRFVRAQHDERLVFPAYAQDAWVGSQDYQACSWPGLVDLWRLYNHHLAHLIRRVPAARLAVSCEIGGKDPVTLGYLIEDYVAHLRHHLEQIDERQAG